MGPRRRRHRDRPTAFGGRRHRRHPLGTRIFIPEFVGLPSDPDGSSPHDGCFVAEDRGIQVVGRHVDVFTGAVEMTRSWDGLVPTNQGVSVYVDSPRCRPD